MSQQALAHLGVGTGAQGKRKSTGVGAAAPQLTPEDVGAEFRARADFFYLAYQLVIQSTSPRKQPCTISKNIALKFPFPALLSLKHSRVGNAPGCSSSAYG